MPDARLQRTRDAYRSETFQQREDRVRREYVAYLVKGLADIGADFRRRYVPAEPSDDDLWGV